MDEKTLTEKLIGKDFCAPVKSKPKFYKSSVTQKEYPYDEYANHGKGEPYKGYKDLPIEEYPYIILY